MTEQLEVNIEKMNRELYCPKCHIYSHSIETTPKCYNCNVPLITVVYSILTGKRITGEGHDRE